MAESVLILLIIGVFIIIRVYVRKVVEKQTRHLLKDIGTNPEHLKDSENHDLETILVAQHKQPAADKSENPEKKSSP